MKTRYFLISALMLPLLAACSKDEPAPVAIETPTATETAATPTSLTFEWTKVKDAVQYAYQLEDATEKVLDGGTTSGTKAEFTGLTPSTEYTMKVWAYADPNDKTKEESPAFSLKASTVGTTPLATPKVTCSGGESLTFAWSMVENAVGYTYKLTSDKLEEPVEGETTSTRLNFADIPLGDYTLAVVALADSEWYTDSEPGIAEGKIARIATETCSGTFTLTNDPAKKWDAKIAYYNDGTCTIFAWHGTSGYNLTFLADEEGNVTFPDLERSTGYYAVAANSTESKQIAPVYADMREDGGDLKLMELSDGEYVYTWKRSKKPPKTQAKD